MYHWGMSSIWGIAIAVLVGLIASIVGNLLTPTVQDNLGKLGDVLAWPWTDTLIFLAMLLIVSVVAGARRVKQQPPIRGKLDSENRVSFYTTRTEMINKTGGLLSELQEVECAWASFEVGSHFVSIPENLQRKIQRLILLHPDAELVPKWTGFDDSSERASASIREATRRARRLGCEVRWSKGPILNAVLGEPNSKNGWVRVQSQFPYCSATNWPNYEATFEENEQLVNNVREAYLASWEHSEPSAL